MEQELDIVLRHEHSASDGVISARVYDPEVNNQEKLIKLLFDGVEDEIPRTIHASTM